MFRVQEEGATRRLGLRYAIPLLLLLAGRGLYRAGTPMPGAPAVVRGLTPGHVVAGPAGEIFIYGGEDTWRVVSGRVPHLVEGAPPESLPVLPQNAAAAAVGADGTLYAAYGNRIKRIGAAGKATRVAGLPEEMTSAPWGLGDGGPATRALLDLPAGLAVGPDGSLFIADMGDRRIRKVDRRGIITTVAGCGPKGGRRGDGIAAVRAAIRPVSVAVDRKGTLYFCDTLTNSVRKIDGRGIVTTAVSRGRLH